MSRPRGCLKNGLLGCLGLFVILVLITGVTALMAWRGLDAQEVTDRNLAPDVSVAASGEDRGGKVILELHHGEFEINPARPGEGVSVEARFDESSYELLETFEPGGADGWVYTVGFRRTTSGLQAILQALMGGGTETYVRVYLPDDVPIDLTALVGEGGCVADLGGMWLTKADLRFEKGGFDLDISEPLREPMERLTIRGRMGGFAASRLGNASPGILDVNCSMGGADVDLGGAWLNDSDITMAIRMGGMAVGVPRDVETEGTTLSSHGLRETDSEIPVPVLRFNYRASMGEIDFMRR